MKNHLSIAAILALILVVVGCSVLESKTESPLSAASPTAVYTEYIEAAQVKDTKRMKSLMSKRSNRLAAKLAKERKLTIDQFLKAFQEKRGFKLKLRNEKIEGDIAILEEIHENKFWYAVVLIKEEGMWKYAADKTQEERRKRLREDRVTQ